MNVAFCNSQPAKPVPLDSRLRGNDGHFSLLAQPFGLGEVETLLPLDASPSTSLS
jgi:hypothetical protein